MVGSARQVRAAACVQSLPAGLHPRGRRWNGSTATATARAPFDGLTLIDIGCGGGLLSEPMARLGFTVTAIDASENNIKTAAAHAAEQGLEIGYRPATAEQLLAEGAGPFDVVLTMEVIEHVADPGEFLRTCSKLLAPGGLMIVATLNRTLKALALAKIGAEYVLRWVPPGTHDWKQFLKPDELRAFLAGEPVDVHGPFGVAYNPLTGRWSRSVDCRHQLHDDGDQGLTATTAPTSQGL
jgi:2-polyprenyl-6-hydroxyphenyl methylase/3-demethylubiquinone-9 3-methyltransferase